MTEIGFHASHELFPPSQLLRYVQLAEQAGFQTAMCSDHFHPWTERQGESGFAWSWLGAALQATRLTFGTVCAPGQRYHPAVIAQAAATLAEMFPGRFWLAVGTGQALNEHITGDSWPSKPERRQRLKEAVAVMRALWAGQTVTHWGRVRVQQARLYSRPEKPPLLLGAAITPETAEWLGGWTDGLITVGKEPQELRKVVDAFRRGGGSGKPMFLQTALSYAGSEEQALQAVCERWPVCTLDIPLLEELVTPADFDTHTADVQPQDVRSKLRISADVQQHIAWLQADIDLGFSTIYLHYLGRDMQRFLEVFGESVLPALAGTTSQVSLPPSGEAS